MNDEKLYSVLVKRLWTIGIMTTIKMGYLFLTRMGFKQGKTMPNID